MNYQDTFIIAWEQGVQITKNLQYKHLMILSMVCGY